MYDIYTIILLLLVPISQIQSNLMVNYTTVIPCQVNVTCKTLIEPTDYTMENTDVNPCEINVACTATSAQEVLMTQSEKPVASSSDQVLYYNSTTETFEGSFGLPFKGVLYPRVSESRDLLSLDGLWNFMQDHKDNGIRERWFQQDLSKMNGSTLMPVPSSYNDITSSASVRDHVGSVWYQRKYYVPSSWKTEQQRIWLRFSGVHYKARVWSNGRKVLEHEIGSMPFQGEITKFINIGGKNKITVSVDNRLGPETIPQGKLEQIDTKRGVKIIQKNSYGFYNYAGIHRSVWLYTTPKVYIDDIWLTSEFISGKVFILYRLFCKGISLKDGAETSIKVIDRDGIQVGKHSQIKINVNNVSGTIELGAPKLWWPYLMSPDPGYLYTVEISVKSIDTGITDVYRQPFGIREIRWNNKQIFINNKPIYFRGINRHEESDIRGQGLDLPTAVRDHNLLKWLGVNIYRTSNCPHAEESMDLAEQMGFMIIDEVQSINTHSFTDKLLNKHKMAMAELINRDKNRACVIMWSVANEPETEIQEAGPYFGSVVSFTRRQDKTRPITATLNRWNTVDQAGQWMDIICFNRYNGYFKEPGRWEIVQSAVENEAEYWNRKYDKPVIMSEFGTETYEGLHNLPECLWDEEYQKKVLSEHFKAFDYLRGKGWFIGEMVFSFTDFKTEESIKRIGGMSKKGIFTYHRQPKSAAFFLRKRNFKLAALMNETALPSDLELYYLSADKLETDKKSVDKLEESFSFEI